jgi:hypothetical protein
MVRRRHGRDDGQPEPEPEPEPVSAFVAGSPLNPASTGYGSTGFLPFPTAPPSLQPAPPNLPNAWITTSQILNSVGHPLTASELAAACPGLGRGRGGGGEGGGGGGGPRPAPQSVVTQLQDCVAQIGTTFHQVVSYQPASQPVLVSPVV